MKIALLGYGRMGKAIESIAVERGHTIVYKTSTALDDDALNAADIAIDFSIPDVAFKNITTCFDIGIPVISGTTGWLNDYDEAVRQCKNKDAAFIYASNFSIGVNLFFKLNDYLAKLMSNQNDYDVALEEIHHTKKLDAPSGTAITLAEQVIKQSPLTNWVLKEQGETASKNELPITAKRIPEVPGTHTVSYTSSIDQIDITHTAHSRKGFALGAVIAAEWLQGKTGVFTMADVLNAII